LGNTSETSEVSFGPQANENKEPAKNIRITIPQAILCISDASQVLGYFGTNPGTGFYI
jgi:hypothetical protein